MRRRMLALLLAAILAAALLPGCGRKEAGETGISLNDLNADVDDPSYLIYSDDRADFASDIVFANFRVVRGGDLKADFFYRSASPCDDQCRRAAYANALAEEAGIRFVLNLADTEEMVETYRETPGFESDYYASLCDGGSVLYLYMTTDYRSGEFIETISGAFAELPGHDGPVLIHCLEGKERSGSVCALLLALAGASAEEIVDDYMMSFSNYYGVTQGDRPVLYRAIRENICDFLRFLCGAEPGTDPETLDLKRGAEDYLRLGGLDDAQIRAIEEYITE